MAFRACWLSIRRGCTVVAAVAACSFVAIPSAAATVIPNLPGYCGVRISGPNSAGLDHTYFMENKCTTGWSFKFYLPTYGRYATSGSGYNSTCQYVDGYGATATFWSLYADPNWLIQNC